MKDDRYKGALCLFDEMMNFIHNVVVREGGLCWHENDFLSKGEIQTIRKKLMQEEVEVVTVKELSKDIERWRFNDEIGGKFGEYLMEKYPDGLKVING